MLSLMTLNSCECYLFGKIFYANTKSSGTSLVIRIATTIPIKSAVVLLKGDATSVTFDQEILDTSVDESSLKYRSQELMLLA